MRPLSAALAERRVVLAGFVLAAMAAGPLAAQCPDGTPPPCNQTPPGANSVAVLLFANLSRDTAYAYLSEGLSSEIATGLAEVARLEVRSPGLVRSVQRHAEADPRRLGRRLGVRYVVEGDFQRSADRIRVSARLVAVSSGTQRWSNAYTRSASDLLAVQVDVAREVATSIAGRLLPQERTVLASRASADPAAWDHFLRGNYYLARRSHDGIDRAIEEFGTASRLDPTFSRAEAGIALAYALYIDWGWPTPVSEDSLLARGLAAADRAIARDSLNADGWMARGYLRGFQSPRDYSHALPDFQRAIALDPRNAETLHQYASKLAELNDAQGAIDMERRALAIDPDRPVSQMVMAKAYRLLRRDDEAIRAFDSSLVLDPSFYASHMYRGQIALERGDVAGACREADAAARIAQPGDALRLILRVACLAARGDSAAALRTLAEAAAPYDTAAAIPMTQGFGLAYAACRVNRPDDAMRWLARVRPQGAILWSELLLPTYDGLRADPRFQLFMDSIRPVGSR